jgi:2-amino-4-hydroxy-6-hydroxymethyldihydropteridine diphosphokinase
MSTLALIGLGSNLGDRRAILDAALAELATAPGVLVRAVSSYHETAPVGGPKGQGPFLNAAAALVTSLSPQALAELLHELERQAGRVRLARWGERTLDLDLLLFGDQVIDTPHLIVPHPGMAVRRFVLAPLAEVAPEVVDPLTKRSVANLLKNLDRRPSCVALAGSFSHGASALWRPDPRIQPLAARVASVVAATTGFRSASNIPIREWSTLATAPGEEMYDWTEDMVSAVLDRAVAELERGRGADEVGRARWVVTDFWLDEFHDSVKWASPRSSWPRMASLLEKARPRIVEPTFVVFLERLPGWVCRARSDSSRGSDRPILLIRSPEAARFQTMLDEATNREPDMLSTDPAWQTAWDGWLEAVASEVVAACEATRT